MTLKFGVEFEFVGMGSNNESIGRKLHSVINIGDATDFVFSWGGNHPSTWKVKGDSSVQRTDLCTCRNTRTCNVCRFPGGAELVSPILQYGEKDLVKVYQVCEALKECGAFTNETCGFHVHFDATWLRTFSTRFSHGFLKHISDSYAEDEEIFDTFVSARRQGNSNSYCRSLKGITWYSDMDRYFKLNTQAYLRHGTVEFRHFHGSVDAPEVLDWITFCGKYYIQKRKEYIESAIDTNANGFSEGQFEFLCNLL